MTTIAASAPPAAAHPRVARPARRARPEGGTFRRIAMAASVIALPLQDHIPPLFGFSVIYLAFMLLGAIALLGHPRALWQAATSRVFVTAYVLVFITFLIESVHPGPSYLWWSRMAQMVAGGVIFAALCRTDRDVRAVLTGVVLAGVWVAVLITQTTWGLRAASAVGFSQVSMLRVEVLGEMGLRANWNALALICAAAAGVAGTRAVLAKHKTRLFYLLVTMTTVFAVFGTFSRSGVAALAITFAYVFYALMNRKLFLRLAIFAVATVMLILLAVPRVVFERFQFSLGYEEGKMESRAMVYSTIVKSLPEYFLFGVGEGNYWRSWAARHDLLEPGSTNAIGAHNSPLQVLLYWGAPGLFCWMLLMLVAWITLMSATKGDLQGIALKAFCLTIFLTTLVSHDISDKFYSIALGLIAGAFMVRRRKIAMMRKAAAS